MQTSSDSQFDGSQTYAIDGGVFSINTSDLPRSQSFYQYELDIGAKGGTVDVNVNALTAPGQYWVIYVNLPPGSTGVDFYFRVVNNANDSIWVSTSYDRQDNTTSMYFSTKNMSGEPSYIELVLPGRPFSNSYGPNGFLPPGTEMYSVGPAYCFLEGALIETDCGEVRVEELTPGQNVMTYDAQGARLGWRTITWTGHNTGQVGHTGHDDVDHRPICILENAFGGGMPHTTLSVTPEHCFLIDGVLLPARMLVNHRSVFYLTDLTRYPYFHFKTEGHAIVRANGVLTETLRDDVRQFVCRSAGGNAEGTGLNALAEAAFAAPLCTDHGLARTIHTRLDEQATAMGLQAQTHMKVLEHDAGLHLVLADGRRLDPIRLNQRWAVFSLPAGQNAVQIVSRHARPCDTYGPYLDDRRDLGVRVGEVTLFGSDITRPVTAHLDNDAVAGWYDEGAGAKSRWTNGRALLSLGEALGTQALLTIEVLETALYLQDYSTGTVASEQVAA